LSVGKDDEEVDVIWVDVEFGDERLEELGIDWLDTVGWVEL
jgi:hypothetical protein